MTAKRRVVFPFSGLEGDVALARELVRQQHPFRVGAFPRRCCLARRSRRRRSRRPQPLFPSLLVCEVKVYEKARPVRRAPPVSYFA